MGTWNAALFSNDTTLDAIEGIRILPLCFPPGINGTPDIKDFIPPLEYWLKAIMYYYKKVHYPKKHMTYVGNQYISKTSCDGRYLEWEKDKMEDWLVEYYLDWQNVEY